MVSKTPAVKHRALPVPLFKCGSQVSGFGDLGKNRPDMCPLCGKITAGPDTLKAINIANTVDCTGRR
jgi:hypothetical protein